MHMSLLLIISWYISLIIKIHWHTKNTFNLFPFSNYFLSLFPFSKLYCVFPRSCYFPFFDAEYVPITLIIKTTVFLPCQYLMIIQFPKMELVMVCFLREFCLYRVIIYPINNEMLNKKVYSHIHYSNHILNKWHNL